MIRAAMILGLGLLASGCASSGRVAAIRAPTIDLRAQPHTQAQPGVHDPLQETQLLYGEQIRVLKREDGWAQVEAVEQAEFTHARRWQGYPGWIPESAISPAGAPWPATAVVTSLWASTWHDAYQQRPAPLKFAMGTQLRAIDMGGQLWKVELLDGSTVWMRHDDARSLESLAAIPPLDQRRLILESADRLMGHPYYWGGRSPDGLDCSGLVNLIYRAAGLAVPRDAHEQHLRATKVNALQPADLLFLSERGNPDRIVHVMVYAGEGEVIEAPGTGEVVRRIAVAQRLGHPLDWLAPGAVVDEQTVTFGSFLP